MIQFSVDPQEGREVIVQAEGRNFRTRCVLRTEELIRLEIQASNGASFVEFTRDGNQWIVLDSYTDSDKRTAQ